MGWRRWNLRSFILYQEIWLFFILNISDYMKFDIFYLSIGYIYIEFIYQPCTRFEKDDIPLVNQMMGGSISMYLNKKSVKTTEWVRKMENFIIRTSYLSHPKILIRKLIRIHPEFRYPEYFWKLRGKYYARWRWVVEVRKLRLEWDLSPRPFWYSNTPPTEPSSHSSATISVPSDSSQRLLGNITLKVHTESFVRTKPGRSLGTSTTHLNLA